MADIEKVIKGLEYCIADEYCDECPYTDDCFAIDDKPYGEKLLRDALALLKEQDGKPMIENETGWYCPSCGMTLIEKTASGYPCNLIDLPEDEPIHFCPKCGQAVKWE